MLVQVDIRRVKGHKMADCIPKGKISAEIKWGL